MRSQVERKKAQLAVSSGRGRRSLAWLLSTGLCLLLNPGAQAELKGDCTLLAPNFGNPGLGCANQGAACTINGAAGKCTNMRRPISSLIYCVCSPDGTKVPEEVEAKAVARAALPKACGFTAIFDIDESAPHIVDIAFPRGMGKKVVRLEAFSGSFTVKTIPLADDPTQCQIAIDSGEFVAPSFDLPDGRSSGLNIYTFASDNSASGTVDLSTGKYNLAANGRISNGLYSELPTLGTYRGTVDFDAGTITIDTTTLDELNRATPKPILPF